MKKLWSIFIFLIASSNYIQPMNYLPKNISSMMPSTFNKENSITLITQNHTFTVPKKIAFLSHTIKEAYLQPVQRNIENSSFALKIKGIDSEVLKRVLWILTKIDSYNSSSTKKAIIINNYYITQNLLKVVFPLIEFHDINFLESLIHASNFLVIPFLTNALVSVWVSKKLVVLNEAPQNVSLDQFSSPYFLENISPLIGKHLNLLKFNLQEYTLADHLALNPLCILTTQIEDGYKVNLSHLFLTSLEGINLLNAKEKITHVDASHNVLVSLSENDFSTLPNLRSLSFTSNNLTELPHTILHQLPALESLNLSNNQINYFHKDLFKNSKELKELYLENNDLSVDALLSLPSHLQNIPIIKNYLKRMTQTSDYAYFQLHENNTGHQPNNNSLLLSLEDKNYAQVNHFIRYYLTKQFFLENIQKIPTPLYRKLKDIYYFLVNKDHNLVFTNNDLIILTKTEPTYTIYRSIKANLAACLNLNVYNFNPYEFKPAWNECNDLLAVGIKLSESEYTFFTIPTQDKYMQNKYGSLWSKDLGENFQNDLRNHPHFWEFNYSSQNNLELNNIAWNKQGDHLLIDLIDSSNKKRIVLIVSAETKKLVSECIFKNHDQKIYWSYRDNCITQYTNKQCSIFNFVTQKNVIEFDLDFPANNMQNFSIQRPDFEGKQLIIADETSQVIKIIDLKEQRIIDTIQLPPFDEKFVSCMCITNENFLLELDSKIIFWNKQLGSLKEYDKKSLLCTDYKNYTWYYSYDLSSKRIKIGKDLFFAYAMIELEPLIEAIDYQVKLSKKDNDFSTQSLFNQSALLIAMNNAKQTPSNFQLDGKGGDLLGTYKKIPSSVRALFKSTVTRGIKKNNKIIKPFTFDLQTQLNNTFNKKENDEMADMEID